MVPFIQLESEEELLRLRAFLPLTFLTLLFEALRSLLKTFARFLWLFVATSPVLPLLPPRRRCLSLAPAA